MRVLRGNPSKAPYNLNEPKPPMPDPSFDEPPPELASNPRARDEWIRVAPLVRVCGLVSIVERPVLLAACIQWARYVEAHEHVVAEGAMVKRALNQWLGISDRALAQCLRLWCELGLTPSSRSKVVAVPVGTVGNPSGNEWAGIL